MPRGAHMYNTTPEVSSQSVSIDGYCRLLGFNTSISSNTKILMMGQNINYLDTAGWPDSAGGF